MQLIQILLKASSGSEVARYTGSSEQGYTDLREYMFSLFRMRQLQYLLDNEHPTAQTIMAWMANTYIQWDNFKNTNIKLSVEDIQEMLIIFDASKITLPEQLVSLLRTIDYPVVYRALF